MEEIAERRNIPKLDSIRKQSIEDRILEFLTSFANGARYANLDSLTATTNTVDPLAQWNSVIHHIVENDVPRSVYRRIVQEAQPLAVVKSVSLLHDMENQLLSLEGAYVEEGLHVSAAPYAVWHVIQIIKPLKQVMRAVGKMAQEVNAVQFPDSWQIPTMSDFLDFIGLDKKAIMRKKRWP